MLMCHVPRKAQRRLSWPQVAVLCFALPAFLVIRHLMSEFTEPPPSPLTRQLLGHRLNLKKVTQTLTLNFTRLETPRF